MTRDVFEQRDHRAQLAKPDQNRWTGYRTLQVPASMDTLARILARELESDGLLLIETTSTQRGRHRFEVREAKRRATSRRGDIRLRTVDPKKTEVSFIGDIGGPSRQRTIGLIVYGAIGFLISDVFARHYGWLGRGAVLAFVGIWFYLMERGRRRFQARVEESISRCLRAAEREEHGAGQISLASSGRTQPAR